MLPLDRQPLSRQVASRLLDEIRDGRWRTRLPGYRDLGALLGVSRTTIEAALDQLTQQGVLMPPNGKRGRRILHECVTPDPQKPRRVIFVGGTPFARLWPFTASVVDETMHRLHRRGYETDYVACPALLQPHPETLLDELLRKNPECLWILVKPLHAAVQWAIARQLPSVLLGGEVRGHGALPCVASLIAPQLADATRILIGHGHREIVICISDLGAYGRAATIQQVRPLFEEAGIPFQPARNVPEFPDDSPEDFVGLLERLFRINPPTGMVVNWVGEALALTSFCTKHGLRLPRDLSVIVAKLDELTAWHVPALTGYTLSAESYVTHLERWVESGGTSLPPGITRLMPRFIQGETLAFARSAPMRL